MTTDARQPNDGRCSLTSAMIIRESGPQLIWDLPIRLWHWLFAGVLLSASVISLGLGEHSSLFPYHSLLGLIAGFLIVLRLIWGVIGTRHARFGSLPLAPGGLFAYLRGVALGHAPRSPGHNPAAAYATIAMLVLTFAICVSGIALSRGNEGLKEIHEVCVYALLTVAGAHILGLVLHTIRHREPIALAMIHGKKSAGPGEAIGSPRPMAALAFLVLAGAWTILLVRAYDPATRVATIPFTSLRLNLSADEGPEGDGFEGDRGGSRKPPEHHDASRRESHEQREEHDD